MINLKKEIIYMIRIPKNKKHSNPHEILNKIYQSGGGTLWKPNKSKLDYYIQPNGVNNTFMNLTGYTGFNINRNGIIDNIPIAIGDVNNTSSIERVKEPSIKLNRKYSNVSELNIPLTNVNDNKSIISITTYKPKQNSSVRSYHKYDLISAKSDNLRSASSRSIKRYGNKSTQDIISEKSYGPFDLDVVKENLDKNSPNKSKSIEDITNDMIFDIYNDRILNYNLLENDEIRKQQKEIWQYLIDYYENSENNNILEIKDNIIIKCYDKNQSNELINKQINNSVKNKKMLLCSMIEDITQFYYIADNIAIINLVGNNCTMDKTLLDQYAEILITIVQFCLGLPKDLDVLFKHRKVLQTYEIDDFVGKKEDKHTDEWYIVEKQYNDYLHYVIDMLAAYYRIDIKLKNFNQEINNILSSFDNPRHTNIQYFNNFQLNILYLYDEQNIEGIYPTKNATPEQLSERNEIIKKKIQILKENRSKLGEEFNKIHNENVIRMSDVVLSVDDNNNIIDYNYYNMSDFLTEFQSYKYLIKYDYDNKQYILPTIEELENAVSNKVEKINDYKEIYYFYPMIMIDKVDGDKIYYKTIFETPDPDDEN